MSATQAIPFHRDVRAHFAPQRFASIVRWAVRRSAQFVVVIAEVIREARALEAHYRDRGRYPGFRND